MKRLVFRFLILIMFSIQFLTSCSQPTRKEDGKQAAILQEQINELPDMVLQILDGTSMPAKTLLGKKSILILFQPDCDHCRNEARQIKENMAAFKNYELYFISIAKVEEIKNFSIDFKLNDRNIHFATTDLQSILKNYGQIQTPSLYIYSEKGKLLAHFNGQTEIGIILKAI